MAKEKIVKDNNERWLLTYADLMNLLLILFIILFSMSQVNTEKFQKLSQSLSSAFGNGEPPSLIQGGSSGNSLIDFPATMPSPVIPSKIEDQQMEALQEEIKDLVDSEGLKGNVAVTMEDRGIVVRINEKILFKSGSAIIETKDQDTLITIGKDMLSKINKHIRVEGHTDNIPMKSVLYASNWELSAARAINVLKLLVDKGGVNPKMINPVPYGEFSPLVPNTSDVNRAKNRRVDIVILRDSSSKGEADTDNQSSAAK